MKREKRIYENGYWSKIEYWTGLLDIAWKQKDIEGTVLCVNKLEYFVEMLSVLQNRDIVL